MNPDEDRPIVASYLTSVDGVLIDLYEDGGRLVMHAGRSLDPADRPVVATFDDQAAHDFAVHLTAFVRSVREPPDDEARDAERLALINQMAGEIAHKGPIEMHFSAHSAMHLAGLMLLALRHPQVAQNAHHHRIATTFVEHIRRYFADSPGVLQALTDDLRE